MSIESPEVQVDHPYDLDQPDVPTHSPSQAIGCATQTTSVRAKKGMHA